MRRPTECPRCGAGVESSNERRVDLQCGSRYYDEGGCFIQGPACQLDLLLRALDSLDCWGRKQDDQS